MTSKFWMEKAWGDSMKEASIKDVKTAIAENMQMDEEHGAFWVGHKENDFVLEVHKNCDLFFLSGENLEEVIQTKLESWDEVQQFFQLFFEGKFQQLKNEIESRPFTYKRFQIDHNNSEEKKQPEA